MKIIFLFLLMAISQIGLAQANWEKEWLHQLANERTISKNHFYKTSSDLNAPMIIGVPLGWAAAGLLKKDIGMSVQGLKWLAAQVVNGGITYALKVGVNRPRPAVSDPTLPALEDVRIHSFPSGHTSSAFALATSISLDHPKWFIIAPSYLYASLVGYSRCYLGVHYPSDVLAGALLGTASAWATHEADRWLHQSKKKKKEALKLAHTY